jgi:hypothetical protein
MKQWGLAGAYQNEEQAARAHDSAALKYWGPGAFINFPVNSCPPNAPVFLNAPTSCFERFMEPHPWTVICESRLMNTRINS